MKNFFKAYTLAELLITLAIISVVAAVGLPALNGLKNNSIKPGILRTANILEAGIVEVVLRARSNEGAEDNSGLITLNTIKVKDIYSDEQGNDFLLTNNGFDLFERCSSFLGVQQVNDNDYVNALRTNNVVSNDDEIRVYKPSKVNTYIIVKPFTVNDDMRDDDRVSEIFIDGNAKKGPNRLDRDIERYEIQNNGHVVKQ